MEALFAPRSSWMVRTRLEHPWSPRLPTQTLSEERTSSSFYSCLGLWIQAILRTMEIGSTRVRISLIYKRSSSRRQQMEDSGFLRNRRLKVAWDPCRWTYGLREGAMIVLTNMMVTVTIMSRVSIWLSSLVKTRGQSLEMTLRQELPYSPSLRRIFRKTRESLSKRDNKSLKNRRLLPGIW